MQGRLYRSTKLWSFYCDLEESLGTVESTRAVYNKILELRIATPQIILNFALFLQVRLLGLTLLPCDMSQAKMYLIAGSCTKTPPLYLSHLLDQSAHAHAYSATCCFWLSLSQNL